MLNEPTLMLVLNILLAITGFLTVFLLQAIWKSQRDSAKAISGALERIIAVEVKQNEHARIIDRVDRCRDCPRGAER